MKTFAIFVATCLAGLTSAQQFNWYTDMACQDFMTSSGGPSQNGVCDGTPFGANSVLLVNCRDTVCAGWSFFTAGGGCLGTSGVDGFSAPCTDCQTTCETGRCIDIGDQDAFLWVADSDSCPGEPGGSPPTLPGKRMLSRPLV